MSTLAIPFFSPAFNAGMVLSLSLIMAIGPQNAHVLRMGLQRQHVWLTVGVCIVADVLLIALGVLGLAQLGGLSDKLQGALVGAGVLFLAVYGWEAARRFMQPAQAAVVASATPTQPATLSRRQAVASALAFYDGYRCANGSANILQAQRDFFGAHTYQRVDRDPTEHFHTRWLGDGGEEKLP